MIRYLADTNILGYFARRASPLLLQRMVVALQNKEIAISVITRAETRFGLALLSAQDKRRASINLLLQEIPALVWTPEAADRYGEIASYLHKTGKPIGAMDTMIAAHARAADLTVVTHNVRHFKRVEGLRVEDWMI